MSAGNHHGDEWHHHSAAEEGLPQREHGAKVSPTALGVTFVVMTLGVAFTIVVLTAYFNSYNVRYRSSKQEGVVSARAAYELSRDQANARLREFGWIDRTAGTVHVPLDLAAERIVAEYDAASGNGSGS